MTFVSVSPTPARVFRDPSGRRWRRVRRAALVLGALTTLAGAAIVAGILIPPLLPAIADNFQVKRNLRGAPKLATTRKDRARLAEKRRLFVALEHRRPPLGVKTPFLPVRAGVRTSRGTPQTTAGPRDRANPVQPQPPDSVSRNEVAGFYVNWDDNSFSSFEAHASVLDWVVCEWGFLSPGGDSVRLAIDRKVLYVAQRQPPGRRPRVLLMVGNFDSRSMQFDARRLRALVTRAAARAKVIAELTGAVEQYGLAGVTIDFEEIPSDLDGSVAQFARELQAALHSEGAILSQAVSIDMDSTAVRAYAAANDRLFLMLYDEHFRGSDPGAVASQPWYVMHARKLLQSIPPNKAILALGAYGYDWNDGDAASSGTEMTFQDVMAAAKLQHAHMQYDSVAMNPFITWTEPDSTDHVVWFLDGVTAFNEMRAARTLGAIGEAIWRLGSEDPGVWQTLGRSNPDPRANLVSIPPGYDVKFDGEGEILHLAARPTAGRRTITVDPVTGLITDERLMEYPSPYVVEREGASPHRVALTFDDGPDTRWTPAILDTLASRNAPATFFLIGTSVERHIPLARRIVAEGNEFGNHTFTHPNLALTSPFVTRLELDANERLLEAVFDRRSAFFRPPYFGDAEPTTADELVPVSIAADLGYITVGLHIDSDDWKELGADRIVQTVIAKRPLGNVVLLHDGGGDRSQTVAALGPIIDSLRAHGDTIVQLSDLAGYTREEAMPPLPASSAVTRMVELASFGLVGGLDWGMHWMLLIAVALGIGRLIIITGLALIQRFRGRRAHPQQYSPSVSVVVPAFNEALVISRTIDSLLAQDYEAEFEIVVVDDGSSDATYAVARASHEDDPRVAIYSKPNGGKASALNYGIARARGEIVVGLDADTLFLSDTLRKLVAPLADPTVGAVAGNAKVGNRINVITRWQAIEYVVSQNIDRRAFSLLNCITVVPGAVGAWRKSLVKEVGGFSEDTLAEDQDLTLAIRRNGASIAYADDAIAYTEAPDTFGGLAKQRFRWSFGTLQCMWKHRDALFRPRYGTLGMIAMPNVWLFQLLFTALSPLADLLFVWSLVSVWLVKQQHGATYAVTDLEQVLTFYAVFLVVDWVTAVIAFVAEPGEDKSLTWLVFLQRFAYRQIMYWVVLRSFMAAIRGHIVGWGKLERKASVEVPA